MNETLTWWGLGLGAVVAVVFTVAILARRSARQGIDMPLQMRSLERGGNTLVTLAHGYRGTLRQMESEVAGIRPR